MPLLSNDSGCPVCRQQWASGQRPEEIALNLASNIVLQTRFYRCAVCGSYWEEDERGANVIPETAVRADYPGVIDTDHRIESDFDTKVSRRRRNLLVSGALTTIFTGLYFKDGIKKIMKSDISAMSDQYAMLMNIGLRRSRLQNAPLMIKNAVFRHAIHALVCENTQFDHCDFTEEAAINVKSFNNVKFSHCTMDGSKISSGIWRDVLFDACSGRGEFDILGDEGSRNVVFDKCRFTGPPPAEGSFHENNFGSAGTYGVASFVNCDLTYMSIEGPEGLSIKDSRLNKVKATVQRKRGDLYLEKVDIKEYLNLTSGIFSSVVMKKVRYDYMDMDSVNADAFVMEDSSGHFAGKLMVVNQMRFRQSSFSAHVAPQDATQREDGGFSLIYSTIGALSVEDVQFSGRNGALFLGGAVNLLYKKDEPKFGGPIGYTKYRTISIKNTSLKGAFLSYMKSGELSVDQCDIDTTDFSNSQIDKISIIGSTLSGKVDFSDTVIGRFSAHDNIRKPDARIISDTNKLVMI